MVETFEASYDAAAAARVERAFYVRSVRELRPLMTLAPPIGLSVFVVAGIAVGAPIFFVVFFALMFCLSVLLPLFMYIARPLAAKRYALRHPVRKITLTPRSIQTAIGDQSTSIAWGRIKHVWEVDDHVLLVLGRFEAICIPNDCLSSGARDFIRASVQKSG